MFARQRQQHRRHGLEFTDVAVAEGFLVLVAVEVDGKHRTRAFVFHHRHPLGHAMGFVHPGAVLAVNL